MTKVSPDVATARSVDPVGEAARRAANNDDSLRNAERPSSRGEDLLEVSKISVTSGPGRSGEGPVGWTLRILGRPMLFVDHRRGLTGGVTDAADVTGVLSPRMVDLLVFLALHREGVRRDAVVAALWPETGGRRPSNNLSSLISRLRTAIRASAPEAAGSIVTVEGDRYRLSPNLVVDYWEFLDEARDSVRPSEIRTTAMPLGPEQLCRLYRAHRRYCGPLGDGIDHAWILSVREAARRTFLGVASKLIRHHAANDPATALELLEMTRSHEPGNQAVYRDIIALQLRLGDNDAAAATVRLLQLQLAEYEQPFDDATVALVEEVAS